MGPAASLNSLGSSFKTQGFVSYVSKFIICVINIVIFIIIKIINIKNIIIFIIINSININIIICIINIIIFIIINIIYKIINKFEKKIIINIEKQP